MGYRWRRSGSTVLFQAANQTAGFFTVTNVQTNVTYNVVVTNAANTTGFLSSNATVTVLVDTDGDGLPDDWETAFGLNPASRLDRDLDSDGDGMLNWQEYIAGTDPTNALSYLKISSIAATGGATISFGAISNKTYTVLFSDTLGTGPWFRLTDVPARTTNGVEVIVDPAYTSKRFYRLATPQQPGG